MKSVSEFQNQQAYIRRSFPVLEMTCAACAVSVESMLKSAPGVKSASVNFANQSAQVEYDPTQIVPADLQKIVSSIGYGLVVDVEDPQAVKDEATQRQFKKLKTRTIWSAALSISAAILGMFFADWKFSPHLSMLVTAPVVFYFGRNFFINAFKQARFGR